MRSNKQVTDSHLPEPVNKLHVFSVIYLRRDHAADARWRGVADAKGDIMDSEIIVMIVFIALFVGGFAVLEIHSRRSKRGEQSPQPADSTMSAGRSVQARGEE